jgi:hypothetical protein
VALSGALAAAAAATTEVQSTSVVLVTAGEVDSCGVDLERTAADAYQATGSRTFVVAPTSVTDFRGLDAIAAAGGTAKAIRIGAPDGERLSDALVPIRAPAYSCSIPIPQAPDGAPLHFWGEAVQVSLDDGAPVVIPGFAVAADCGADFGWYLDAWYEPTSIVLCPALCDAVTQNRDSDILVSFSCNPPRL